MRSTPANRQRFEMPPSMVAWGQHESQVPKPSGCRVIGWPVCQTNTLFPVGGQGSGVCFTGQHGSWRARLGCSAVRSWMFCVHSMKQRLVAGRFCCARKSQASGSRSGCSPEKEKIRWTFPTQLIATDCQWHQRFCELSRRLWGARKKRCLSIFLSTRNATMTACAAPSEKKWRPCACLPAPNSRQRARIGQEKQALPREGWR